MRDPLGRLWKVGKPDGKRGYHFQCYEKRGDGNVKVLVAMDADSIDGGHVSRQRTNGKTCGGPLFAVGNFVLCGQCAADVRVRR